MTRLRDRLDQVYAELERNEWPIDKLPDDAPESVVHARLLIEERRLRAMGEAQ